jgi:hypothetical protein
LSNETKAIEVLPCGYQTQCKVRSCKAQATTILRGVDGRGHPTVQWEVCTPHSEQTIVREASKGRAVVRLWTMTE